MAVAGRCDVVGLGVCTLDLAMVVDELAGGEVVQRADASALQGGGPVATALVALARLGSRTAMLDRIGDDWRGAQIKEELEREGVDTDHLLIEAGRTSSIASVLVRKRDGARSIVYSPGNAAPLLPADLPSGLIASAKCLHLNGRHPAACLAAVRSAKACGVTVSFDGGAHRYAAESRELVALSDVCIVARHFACCFAGVEEVEAAAQALLASGPRLVVVTGGMQGSWIFSREETFHQPAFPMSAAVDTTGAGDAYHGGFLYGMVNGFSLRSCALLGSAVAALNTRRLGGRAGLPTLAEARDFLTVRGCGLEQLP
jgi:sugar/nucleoside kinase (ribokinase family)